MVKIFVLAGNFVKSTVQHFKHQHLFTKYTFEGMSKAEPHKIYIQRQVQGQSLTKYTFKTSLKQSLLLKIFSIRHIKPKGTPYRVRHF